MPPSSFAAAGTARILHEVAPGDGVELSRRQERVFHEAVVEATRA